ALDRANPSAKQKQALLDYALWHGQQYWVERLALAGFAPARTLAPTGVFGWVGDAVIAKSHAEIVRHTEQSYRATAALRQRLLQPYGSRNVKDVLRTCDAHGVDHITPVGAT